MSEKIDLNRYSGFVREITSDNSNKLEALILQMRELDGELGVNIALLLTAGVGLASETGEFNEIIKKMLFQGKTLTEENRFHMMRELGDVMWYWTNACRALGYDPNEVIAENVRKLEARYPGGAFDAHYSENRQEGDL